MIAEFEWKTTDYTKQMQKKLITQIDKNAHKILTRMQNHNILFWNEIRQSSQVRHRHNTDIKTIAVIIHFP